MVADLAAIRERHTVFARSVLAFSMLTRDFFRGGAPHRA